VVLMTSIPALYAHRLGRDVGPDSSRAALRATLAGSVDGVETDVCLTADGRLALLHDPSDRELYDGTRLGAADAVVGVAHGSPAGPRRCADGRDADAA
jgi:glycerophosphoryl diester phosphodiesterase